MKNRQLRIALLANLFLLAACGGGGGSAPAPAPAPGASVPAPAPAAPAPAPNPGDATCPSGTTTWTVAGKSCSATVAALANGQAVLVTNTRAGMIGTLPLTCTIDGLVQSIAATCTVNLSPVAALQTSSNGLLVDATSAGSTDPDGTIVSYSWDFGEPGSGSGNTASGPAATHAYRNAGNFTITLLVTDNNGATASRSIQVTPAVPSAVPTGRLNDTGITSTQCHGAGNYADLINCSQPDAVALSTTADGLAGRDASSATNTSTDGKLGFSFTKLGDAGQALAASATQWSCVRDEVTGLMWEVKSVDGGPRDTDKAYTNFSKTYDPNKTFGSPTDAAGYVFTVNAAGLCGAHDWRLPTVRELQGLVDYGAGPNQPQIDAAWFPRTGLGRYWSSTPYTYEATPVGDQAWYVSAADGIISKEARKVALQIRLVRGEPLTGAFLAGSADGQEIIDLRTKLIWRRCVEGMAWNGGTCTGTAAMYPTRREAAARASAQAAATGKGWRVPNIKELASIVETNAFTPAIDTAAFPKTQFAISYWSSTPAALDPTVSLFNPGDWRIEFTTGGAWYSAYPGDGALRLVRDPQ